MCKINKKMRKGLKYKIEMNIVKMHLRLNRILPLERKTTITEKKNLLDFCFQTE